MICSLFLFYSLTMMCAQPQAQQSFRYTLERRQVVGEKKVNIITTLTDKVTGHVLFQNALYHKPDNKTVEWQYTLLNGGSPPAEISIEMREICSKARCKFLSPVVDNIKDPTELAQTKDVVFFYFGEEDIADVNTSDRKYYTRPKPTTLLDKIKAALGK